MIVFDPVTRAQWNTDIDGPTPPTNYVPLTPEIEAQWATEDAAKAEAQAVFDAWLTPACDIPYANVDGRQGALPVEQIYTEAGLVQGTPTYEQKVRHYQRNGWLKTTSMETPADGWRVVSYTAVERENKTCDLLIAAAVNIAAEQAAAEAAAQAAYLADIQANAKYYTLQNAYLLLCESIIGTKTKLTGEAMAVAVAQLKSQDQSQGEKLESAFVFLSGAMVYYNPKWWDEVTYRDVPELVSGAQQLLALKG